MNKRALHLLPFFVLFCLAAYCQPGELFFHHLKVENGLTETENLFFLKDSKGFVWISSGGGLNRYDGHEIKPYFPDPEQQANTMLGSVIQSPFFEDENSNIWFSTYQGLNGYIRTTDSFQHFTFPSEGEPLRDYYVMALDERGQLWIIVGGQLVLFDIKDEKWHPQYELMNGVRRLYVDFRQDGSPRQLFASLMTSPGMLHVVYTNDSNYRRDTLFQSNGEIALNIRDVYVEQENLIWLATDKGLFRYNPLNRDLKKTSDFQSETIENVRSVEPYQDSLLLATSMQDGLLVFHKTRDRFVRSYTHHPAAPHSLASNFTNNAQVLDGGIWVAVNNVGVDFTYPEKQKFDRLLSYPADENLTAHFTATAIAEDQAGNVWIGSEKSGIAMYCASDRTWQYFDPKQYPLLNANINQIIVDEKNQVWILTWEHLLRYNATTESFETPSADAFGGESQRFYWGIQLKKGSLLLASAEGGAFELLTDGQSTRLVRFAPIPADVEYSYFFETSDGKILGSYSGSSLHLFDPEDNYAMQEIPVSNTYVNGMYESPNEGLIWIATENGLQELDKNTWRIRRTYTEKDGLPVRVITGLLRDESGWFWLSSTRGLMRFKPGEEQVRSYDLEDGLAAKEFTFLAYLQDRSGQFWFGSKNGVNRFFPDRIEYLDMPSTPAITDIIVDDDPEIMKITCAETQATNPSVIRKVVLPYRHNTITFEFSALAYSAPSENTYQYRMAGIDPANTWVDAGKTNQARYANLPPGDYLFLVRAANSDGQWSRRAARMRVHVETPWYWSWWAYLSYFIIIASILFLFFYQYVTYLNRMEDTRKEIADNIHDNLGSGLSSINIEAQLALMNQQKDAELLDSISTNAGDLYNKMRNMIWDTKPANDTMENIVLRMREEGFDKFSALPIQFMFEEQEKWENASLSGKNRNHLMSIYREALSNIVKYAQATKVRTKLSRNGQNIIMMIQDNGVGFDESQFDLSPNGSGSGNGLRSMRERARKMGGTIDIDPTPGEGTKITLDFPLERKTAFLSLFDLITNFIRRLQNIFNHINKL